MVLFCILSLLCLGTSGCGFFRGYAGGRSEMMLRMEQRQLSPMQAGAAGFVFDDLGHLNTDTLKSHAIPWKVSTAALLMYEGDRRSKSLTLRDLPEVFSGFGFIWPARVANFPDSTPLDVRDKPLGMVGGTIRRSIPSIELEAVNLGCAACHAGRLYDAAGDPSEDVWLGLPNTSLDLDAYINSVYESLKFSLQNQERLLGAIRELYPDISSTEFNTIARYGLPEARKRMEWLERTLDRPLPFANGGPGVTNGVAALKVQLKLLDPYSPAQEYGYTAIPHLGNVFLKTALLYDSVYAPPGGIRNSPRAAEQVDNRHLRNLAQITAFFTVPTQGGTPASAIKATPAIEKIYKFIGSYRSPEFPGAVDYERAAMGRVIYHRSCAQCHGAYDGGNLREQHLVSLPNRLVTLSEINTDPERVKVISQDLIHAISGSAMNKYVVAVNTGGYLAPDLSGLWATAPYLHNGSVPTLWHLMNPRSRPTKFEIGGHKLDYRLMGVAGRTDKDGTYRYPSRYLPFSKPVVYDTQQRGRSNRGHEAEFAGLNEDEKWRLLEYLKLL
jgi:hypothetical protein